MKKKIALLACGWSNYFLHDFIEGMKRAVKETEVDIYVFNCYNYTEFSGYPNSTGYSIFSVINYQDFDGVIILADTINNQRVLEKERLRILQSKISAISINAQMSGLSCLKVDNYTGTYELIDHLVKTHGLKSIAYISGRETSVDIAERYKAYRTCLSDNQIPIDMEKVFSIKISNYNEAYEFMKKYLEDGKQLPEAFVCANDLIALGILRVAEENNIKIPEQLKIIGYDDNYYAKNVNPGITTVKSNAEQAGNEAIKRVLNGFTQPLAIKVKSSPVYRNSCGCEYKNLSNQNSFTNQIFTNSTKREAFSTQMEILEEIFTDASDVFTLMTNLDLFFQKSHYFEGSDFCIFLKSDWTSVLINSAETLPQNLSYGTQLQSITSIQNNEKYTREIINTRDLIPSKMKSDENSVYLFMPIYNHSYVHGYYVTKNNLALIDNNYGYTWTRTFGNAIERFRKQNMYKQMSQQFLKLSTKDALSGMLNRVGLEKLAKPFYAQNKKNGLTTVLFFVDINKMKHINDNFGHLHGDLAVKTISAAVMEVVPKNWLCIRYGGDEFLVVGNSKNYNGEDYCQIITERIQRKTAVMQLPYNLSASVGTYSVPPSSTLTLEQAVENVDEIMYAKKQEFHKNN